MGSQKKNKLTALKKKKQEYSFYPFTAPFVIPL